MMDQARRKKAQEEATVIDLDEGLDQLEPRSDFGPAIRFGVIGLLLIFVILVLGRHSPRWTAEFRFRGRSSWIPNARPYRTKRAGP